MPKPAAVDPRLSFIFNRPFTEQVAFFRGKLGKLVPTARWDDIKKSAHDRAFMVAGAAKADLLADLAEAVDKAIHDGETLDAFRKRFLEIVERRGWEGWTGDDRTKERPKGGKGVAWRTRIIYQTNLATSYAAGRLAQLKEAGFKYWIYRHSGSEHPRLQHLAWDGLTLPADHPFWQTHYPPSGWGCRCRVVGANGPEGAKLLGGKPGYTEPPEGWNVPDAKGRLPGIDEGWDYMPGATSDLVREIEKKAAKLPVKLGRALAKDLGLPEPRDLGDRLERIGEQLGSMPGGVYRDTVTGDKWYLKLYPDPLQARSEAAALSVYRQLGLSAPQAHIVSVNGQSAIATRWMDGLRRASAEELIQHPDLPKLWQGAVLTKDWDVLGLDLDNVLIDANGRLVKLDAGGAFRFRARGSAKPFDGAIDEVRSLLDHTINPQTARIFGSRFRADVFAEADGIDAVRKLTRARVAKIVSEAGFDADEAKDLVSSIMARRAKLIERYGEADLERVPGARLLRDRMRVWGAAKLTDGYDVVSSDLVPRFERMMADDLGTWAPRSARTMIGSRQGGWVNNSSSPAGAVMKRWARDRFGAAITYHDGVRDIEAKLERHLERTLSASGRTLDDLYRVLDYEYAFHQYYLRRIHGWDEIKLRRGMERTEFENNYAGRTFTANALSSFALHVPFSRPYRIEATVPVSRVLKTYWQGELYLIPSENEYIIIGAKYPARRVK